ncbi:hypothetical protein ZWY2020_010201 [Hordeum vulgare]|nr:hypothetical protein ZWY2020_010201 [Hordeum vulgare]
MGSPPAGRGLGLVGGRFWALPDDDDNLQNAPAASPTPSDIVCESILVGYSEEQVAESIDGFVPVSDPAWEGLSANDEDRIEVLRRVVHRRTSTNAIRPWKGPLPKILDFPDTTHTEIEEVTDVDKEGLLSADSPTGYKDPGVRSGLTGGSKAIPGFPLRSGTARSIPALVSMAARQAAPSAPAAGSSAGPSPAVTAPAAAGPVAAVVATTVAGTRDPKLPDGQGRGSAGAGRGAPGAYNRGGGGGFHGHRGYANHWNDFAGGSGGGRSNWMAGGGPGGGANQWRRPFQPPQGNFVEGTRGSNFRQRGGGGVRNYGRNNSGPIWKEVTQEDVGEDDTPPTQQITTEDRGKWRANKA